jgi:hypothetical protein
MANQQSEFSPSVRQSPVAGIGKRARLTLRSIEEHRLVVTL